MTAASLHPAARPAFAFVGVTTGSSSIRTVFPRWADELGLDADLVGVDLPLHAPARDYRRVVEFLRDDPLTVGALVTTHKIDLFAAARDLFDAVDPLAALMSEASCLVTRDGRAEASAKDPHSAGLAIEAFAPPSWWTAAPREVVLLGAGGSAVAMAWYLSRAHRGDARPARIVATDRDPGRLAALGAVHEAGGGTVPLTLVEVDGPAGNDAVLAAASPGSLVVNATGLGKDAPGSPLTGRTPFPAGSIAWDLNYRGELVFLDQARAQPDVRGLDGWTYFLHGWTQVIAEVFDVPIPSSGPSFERLGALAAGARS